MIRRERYRQLIAEHIDPDETDAIRMHTEEQHVYGGERFHDEIAALTGRAVIVRQRGRPKTSTEPQASRAK